jgi:Putative lumazine-binding
VTRTIAVLTLVLVFSACRLERAPSGRLGGGYTPEPDSAASAEVYAAIRSYYAALTSRDWRLLGEHFWPRATIATVRRAPDDTVPRVRTLTIEEFVAGAGKASVEVFADEALRANVVTYGALADAWVTSHARVGATAQTGVSRYGIDAFHLMKLGGQWRIVSLAFQNEVPGDPIAPGPARR